MILDESARGTNIFCQLFDFKELAKTTFVLVTFIHKDNKLFPFSI